MEAVAHSPDDRSALVTGLFIVIVLLAACSVSLFIDRDRERARYERLADVALRLAYQYPNATTSKALIKQIDKDATE